MARSNTPYGKFVYYKNKYLHELKAPLFHDAAQGFKKCCFATTYVWTSFRWRCTLMRMPAPMNSVSSAVPP